mmetsp:Transcript_57070/g.107526  ORF Transcript_57070/g.107526 Transcript_57070/m.107526 type:complete len:216 (-) Transcript_57070:270-917(-)
MTSASLSPKMMWSCLPVRFGTCFFPCGRFFSEPTGRRKHGSGVCVVASDNSLDWCWDDTGREPAAAQQVFKDEAALTLAAEILLGASSAGTGAAAAPPKMRPTESCPPTEVRRCVFPAVAASPKMSPAESWPPTEARCGVFSAAAAPPKQSPTLSWPPTEARCGVGCSTTAAPPKQSPALSWPPTDARFGVVSAATSAPAKQSPPTESWPPTEAN